MAETLISRGYDIVSGGTENHLILVDLSSKNVTGKDAEHALEEANITTNKNSIPNDPQSPFVTSGIRIGSPAITTRGFKEEQAAQVANWIADVIDNMNDANNLANIKKQVLDFKISGLFLNIWIKYFNLSVYSYYFYL